MSRRVKRIAGNIAVLASLTAILLLLITSAMSDEFLRNDPALTAEANAGTPIVPTRNTAAASAPASAVPRTASELERARSRALAEGRPEAAWDKQCIAWQVPQAATDPQRWANRMGRQWLEAHRARCPDAITIPHYFVDSWSAGEPGTLRIRVEDAAVFAAWPGPAASAILEDIARDFMENLAPANPELKTVEVATGNGQHRAHYDRTTWAKAQDF